MAVIKSNHIEIQRNNVTVNEFLTYVAVMVAKKGMERSFSPEDFTNPATQYLSSYTVVGDKKHCHFADYRTTIHLRGKIKSYVGYQGRKMYYRDNLDLEECEETKLHLNDLIEDATDAPCRSEIIRQFAYDLQTYVLNWDGTCYNEICEFTFDDDIPLHDRFPAKVSLIDT